MLYKKTDLQKIKTKIKKGKFAFLIKVQNIFFSKDGLNKKWAWIRYQMSQSRADQKTQHVMCSSHLITILSGKHCSLFPVCRRSQFSNHKWNQVTWLRISSKKRLYLKRDLDEHLPFTESDLIPNRLSSVKVFGHELVWTKKVHDELQWTLMNLWSFGVQ